MRLIHMTPARGSREYLCAGSRDCFFDPGNHPHLRRSGSEQLATHAPSPTQTTRRPDTPPRVGARLHKPPTFCISYCCHSNGSKEKRPACRSAFCKRTGSISAQTSTALIDLHSLPPHLLDLPSTLDSSSSSSSSGGGGFFCISSFCAPHTEASGVGFSIGRFLAGRPPAADAGLDV
jgi:hypothetical protein